MFNLLKLIQKKEQMRASLGCIDRLTDRWRHYYRCEGNCSGACYNTCDGECYGTAVPVMPMTNKTFEIIFHAQQ